MTLTGTLTRLTIAMSIGAAWIWAPAIGADKVQMPSVSGNIPPVPLPPPGIVPRPVPRVKPPVVVPPQAAPLETSPFHQNLGTDATAITNNHLVYALEDEAGGPVVPLSVVRIQDDLYFLGPSGLWFCAGAKPIFGGPDVLVLRRLGPPNGPISGVPWQEFNDFAYLKERQCLVILDKSGDLFQYTPASKSWTVFRKNGPSLGSPDPDYISLCAVGKGVALLDPERNQIWNIQEHGRALRYFREVMPWRVQAGDPYVGDGFNLAFDDYLYVLRRHGGITRLTAVGEGQYRFSPEAYQKPKHERPTRIIVSDDGTKKGFYIVERENNRVLKVDRATGETKAFNFPVTSNLRNLLPAPKGFWILSGTFILYRGTESATNVSAKCNPRPLEEELRGLLFPVAGQGLPNHAGVFPGARRLYRYGVHEGMDIFGPAMGTPVRAVKDGKVLRADANFVDMTASKLDSIMEQCRREHRTSEKNEDLFRGCQVWIDHGNGMVTRYAHLSRINPGLKVNEKVKRGDLIGFVGVSGTGQNLPGRAKYPHLHFEIRLGDKYLGWGLTPQETIGLYEDIFGRESE
jgi:murein DD-endopeptidase MepM/ murein hydrolase activator NlpD